MTLATRFPPSQTRVGPFLAKVGNPPLADGPLHPQLGVGRRVGVTHPTLSDCFHAGGSQPLRATTAPFLHRDVLLSLYPFISHRKCRPCDLHFSSTWDEM